MHLIVAITGGGMGKLPDGLAIGVPLAAVPRFEALAGPVIEAFLAAFRP
jgi:hypothetical protein